MKTQEMVKVLALDWDRTNTPRFITELKHWASTRSFGCTNVRL